MGGEGRYIVLSSLLLPIIIEHVYCIVHYQCLNYVKAPIRGVVPHLLIRACANLMGSELVETEVLPDLVPQSVPLTSVLTEDVPSLDGVLLVGLQVEDPSTALLPGGLGGRGRAVHVFS